MRHATPTLRGRVSGLALAVIAAWLVVLAVGFDFVLITRIEHQINDALKVRAQAASATLVIRDGALVGVHESATDSELDSSVWVYSGTRRIVHAHGSAQVRGDVQALAAAPAGYAERDNHRFYVLPVRLHGIRVGVVITSLDLAPYDRTKDIIVLGSATVTILLLIGAYPVLRFAAARALRPVAAMTRQAAEWTLTSPGTRFGAGQRHAEISSLAATLDEMLDRMAAVLRHEWYLSAELSHQLRTPLARVVAQVDLLLDEAAPDQVEELHAIRVSCAQMDEIIDSLLAAARSELVRPVGHCELAAVFDAIATDPNPPRVHAGATDLRVGVEQDVIVRILTPLIDNARRYATNDIRLDASRQDGGVRVEVSNDGPRIDPSLAERVFEPGVQIGPDASRGSAGLGLALARRLARAADGELVLDTSAARTTFRLVLPAG